MPTRSHHRKLTEHLAAWDADRVARLLQRRPDLARSPTPRDVAELAQRAQQRPSVVAAIASATLPEHRTLQLVVCCRPGLSLHELAAALPDGVEPADVEATLVALEDAALVWRHDDRVHCSGTLRQAMPTKLGEPLQSFVKDVNVNHLRHAVASLRADATEGGFDGAFPPRAAGSGKSTAPRKADLVDELGAMLTTPGLVAAVLAAAPPESADLARGMADGHPAVELMVSLYFSPYGASSAHHREDGTYWLYERALLLPGGRGDIGVQPREVGVALRGGRPVDDLALDRPDLVIGDADPQRVDAHAAARGVRTLHLLADLVDLWAASPAPALKSGGLGVKAMKVVAEALDVDGAEAGRLVELAHLAGLVDATTTARKEGRRYVHDTTVAPIPAAASWIERPLGARWAQLATAWTRAMHWPSASGRHADAADHKPPPVLTRQYASSAPARRRDVLDLLATLEPGQATTADTLAACTYWQRPHPWLNLGVAPATLIGWVHAEAELLGVVADGAPSSFGRALVGGDGDAAERGLAAALPAAARSFTLQTDLTATVVGDLDRDLMVELRLLADVESTGAATTLRFSDASVRRAIDAGRDGDTVLAFLEAHATKGVPSALAYLVNDVARRHGHLVVGEVSSFVTSDDPAVLADACSHRRTRKLALRLLAPTVAVSPRAPAAVIDGLRAAGFLPIADGEGEGEIVLASGDADVPARDGPVTTGRMYGGSDDIPGNALVGTSRSGGTSGDGLPEPFRARAGRAASESPTVDDAAAAERAELIVAGQGGAPSRPLPFPGGGNPGRFGRFEVVGDDVEPGAFGLDPGDLGYDALDELFDDVTDDGLDDGLDELFDDVTDDVVEEVASLDDLLASAARSSGVVALAMRDGDDLSEPLLLAVIHWSPGRVTGIDLSCGEPTSIATEDIGAALEVGAVGDLAPPARQRGRRRHSSGRRRR
jgi:hypothetical protein